jgi:hypothetical protein
MQAFNIFDTSDTIKVELGCQAMTAGTPLEISRRFYRGFVILEFIDINKYFATNSDYCPDPDNWGTGIPGDWKLNVQTLYRAVRLKNGVEFARGHTIGECTEQIDLALGPNRRNLAIPF